MSLPALSRPLPAPSGLGSTERRDAWWLEAMLCDVVLVAFTLYSLWAILQGAYYEFGPYLSPLYSPNLEKMLPGVLDNLAFSPAFLILWIPLGFRATCYFFRRVYYRSFFASPAGCAVGKAGALGYSGETKFPFILQNAHRYFLYLAILLAIFHWFHAFEAMWFNGQWGVHTGTLVMLLDAIFLTLYVVSCHSFRHIFAGGHVDCLTGCGRLGPWKRQSMLNENHGLFGWVSLVTIMFADFYVRMCAMGIWTDIPLIGG